MPDTAKVRDQIRTLAQVRVMRRKKKAKGKGSPPPRPRRGVGR